MSDEIKYPQRVRGGAGWFPKEGEIELEGYEGARIRLAEGGSPNGGGSVECPIIFEHGVTTLVWKRQGTNFDVNPGHKHPDISKQTSKISFTKIGKADIGYEVTFDFEITIDDPSALGVGPSAKGWYFVPSRDDLKPNFDNSASIQRPGSFQMWVNDGHIDIVGGCKWSRNVGSGIDGILLNVDDGKYPVSETYPRSWPKGSKMRVVISHWVSTI